MLAPPTADIAAHTYRAWLWDSEGFTVWNNQWYGGHHVPGYSILFPPLGGWFGARPAVALCGVLAAAAVAHLVRRSGAAVTWLAVAGVAASLVIGRGPFLLGVAFGALALSLAIDNRRPAAAVAALGCVLASPVAGLFLLVGAVALEPRTWPAIGAPVLIAGGGLALAFPEGGEERFVGSAFWPLLGGVLCLAALVRGPVLRAIVVYVGVLAVAYLVPEPVGQNAARLAVFAGPAVLLAFATGPRVAVLVVCAGFVYLQWLPAYRALDEAAGDPSVHARYYTPLNDLLSQHAGAADRVEVVFTRNHFEAAYVAPIRPIARGWERQLDIGRNALFYEGDLRAAEYEQWLRTNRIRWVALPDAPLDFSAREEAALVRARPAFLREAGRTRHWRLFEYTRFGPQDFVSDADSVVWRGRGRDVVARRWTPYWRVTGGRGCVSGADGEFIVTDNAGPGALRLEARLFGSRCRR